MLDFAAAIGLVLVIEGTLWALSPRLGRAMLQATADTPEGTLRTFGIAAVLVGVGIVWLIRG